MKIYLVLDKKIITGYSYEPIDGCPEVEIENPKEINLGFDTYEKSKIIKSTATDRSTKIVRIMELKKLLADSDYMAIKCFDGEISEEEYAELKAQRHAWREEIRNLTK